MERKTPSRLKHSYVFSYIFIFIVPFLVMSLFFYYNSVKSLREETELSHTHNLGIVQNMIDTHIKQLNKIGAQIAHDYKLSQYMVNLIDEQPAAINELAKYKQSNAIIDELYLHYYNQESVFSSLGSMSTNTFFTYQTALAEKDYHLFDSTYKTVGYPQFDNRRNLFDHHPTFMYPLPPGPTKSKGIVLFKLEETFFGDMINTILGSYEGSVYIFNENNEIIDTYSSDKHAFLDTSIIQKHINRQSQVSEISVDNNEYTLIKVHSKDSNWTYVTALPTKQFFYKVYKFQYFTLPIVAFIIFFALIGAVYIALRQYRPIEKMLTVVKTNDTSFHYHSNNELDNLRMSIETVYKKNANLQTRFTKQEPLMRDQCLNILLQGQTEEAKRLSDSLHLNLALDKDNSFVFVTSLSKELLQKIDMKELESATQGLLKNAKIYSVELINDKLIAFIINAPSSNTLGKQEFLNLVLQLLQEIEPQALIGVGESYEGDGYIHRSFIEASAAFEHGITNEDTGISYYTDIKGSQETIWLPKDLLLKLTQSYKQGNAEIAHESIKSLFSWLQTESVPTHLMRHMQYDIINTIIKTINEFGVTFNFEKIYYLKNIKSPEQLEKNLLEFTTQVCSDISNRKENQQQQLQVDILDYIKNNFTNQDFGLDSIAQEFNLSASYLSRYIKEETQMTFSQYVWELRLEEVKKQLAETELPIKNIVSNVGYIDVSNFSRKFKSSVGLTPGQYRNLCMKDS